VGGELVRQRPRALRHAVLAVVGDRQVERQRPRTPPPGPARRRGRTARAGARARACRRAAPRWWRRTELAAPSGDVLPQVPPPRRHGARGHGVADRQPGDLCLYQYVIRQLINDALVILRTRSPPSTRPSSWSP
jgi:hypothetical protein